jgi:hypothetical protein
MKIRRSGRLAVASLALAGALSVTPALAAELTFNGPGVNIADAPALNSPGAVATSVINVTGAGPLMATKVKLEVNIDQDWIGDLVVKVTRNGTTVTLLDRVGKTFQDPNAGDQPFMTYGSGKMDVAGFFVSDGTGTSVQTKAAPNGNGLTAATAPHAPQVASPGLNTFVNADARGQWTVTVQDFAPYDGRGTQTTGRVNYTRLVIEADVAPDIAVDPTAVTAP